MSSLELSRGTDSVIDLGRYKQVAVVLVAVLVAVFLWNTVIERLHSRISPHYRSILLNLSAFDYQRGGQAVARVEDELRTTPAPLGVVLGLSTALVGIDPHALGAHSTLRWANLAASGGSFTELLHYAGPFLESDLHPEVVVIAASAMWLSERSEKALPILEDEPLLSMLPTPWFWAARNSVRLAIDIPLQRARLVMLRALGVGTNVLFPGVAFNPWVSRLDYPALHAADDWIARLDNMWESFSWFDEAAYPANSPEVERLRSLVKSLQARGAAVAFVILPEPPATREKLPASARNLLRATLDSLEGLNRLDDWAAIADPGLFFDRTHLNAQGRGVYSEHLAAELLPITEKPASH